MGVTWNKVWRDLAHNKARTLLVVLSIAVGVFALGTIFGGYNIMTDYMARENEAWGPIDMTLWGWPFDERAEETVLREPGIADVERVVDTSFRWRLEGDASLEPSDWREAQLYAREDYEAQRMGKVDLWEGSWPEGRTLAIERMTARHLDIPIGSTIVIQHGQHERRLEVVGVIRDSFADPPQFGADPIFFASPETVAWLTDDGYNCIEVRMDAYDQAEAARLVDEIRYRLENDGVVVWGWWVHDPTQHWFQNSVDTVYVILLVLGVLALGLSVFLIVNTTNAIISQQVWQIGVMKAVGATRCRVVRVYLMAASMYGALALLIAIPLGAVGAYLLAGWILELVNITLTTFPIDPAALIVQVVLAVTVPLVAALVPVIGGARITAHRAISTYGLGGGFGRGLFDRLLGRICRLPRPVVLSMRNTFRRKGRVVLTLLTLALGGAMFMMVMSVRASFDHTLDVMLSDFGGDAVIWFEKTYRASRLVEVSQSVPGVRAAEVWIRYWAPLPTAYGEDYILLLGVPPESGIIHPRIAEGRMLKPEDDHAIVMNNKVAVDQGIGVGDVITVRILEEEVSWTVVGLFLNAEDGQSNCLVPLDVLADEVGSPNRGSWAAVAAEEHTPEARRQLVRDLREAYKAHGIETSWFQTADDMREENLSGFEIVMILLLGMAALTAAVGGIGMASTMSINVVERRREIGVMRSTGATSFAIAAIFVAEGMLLGVLSCLFAVPISVPSSRLFSDVVGDALFSLPFDFVYSINGVGLWLGIVVVLSALASLWPALRATRVSVREALAYE
ncbi:MAG: ABC transporter permease [Anaerolineae bacterium]|nr:ABC transporter permease [Anaerolineae bacterium]